MGRRGGYRRRRYVVPGEVPVWVSTGRWGPRRARVEQCATLAAELLYHRMICDGVKFAPGWRKRFTCTVGDVQFPNIAAEVISNAVWRRGRLFLRCPACNRRATRLYVPIAGLQPRCRRCWGLNYTSQSWSYKATGVFAALGPIAYSATYDRRQERRMASLARYAARRGI